ncbi:hypothetical protein [Leclercia tamurae]|uniref:hypothetical protein n=1 Tax=Leclercia tamurae TaxID=2926467 RepID=UPI0036F47CCF
MTKFTKEQLTRIIESTDNVLTAIAGTNDDIHPESDAMLRAWDYLNDDAAPPEVVRELARQLLAGLEQEPVAWTDAEELRDAKEGACGYLFALDGKANKFADPRRMIMLYAAPQLPQPAVVITNEEIDSIVIPISPDGLDEEKYPIEWHLHHDRERIRKALHEYACRAAVLQGAEPAQATTLREWTNEQCLEFLSVAFRHNEISGDIEFDDIRLGVRFALAAAPQQEVK